MKQAWFRSVLLAAGLFLLFAPARAEDAPPATDQRVSMEFDGAELKDVLKIFSQQSGLNFVASQEVESKKITLFLDGVTVQDAMDNIIKANGLRYEREKGSGIFVVYPSKTNSKEITTRIFQLKYTRLSISALDVGGQSVVRDLAVPNEQLSSTDQSSSSSSSSVPTSSVPSITGLNSSESSQEEGRGIDKIVSQLLSKQGSVTVDLRTNSLIVTDYPQNLEKVEEVLAEIDVATRQVMIEVEILEVRATAFKDIGVAWGGEDGALLTYTGGVRTAGFPFQEELFEQFDSFNTTKSGLTLGTLSAANFTATLHFLQTLSDTKILARPRVLTVNNEASIIKLVTSTAIARVSTQSASQGVSVTTSNTAERTDTGIVLKMTPQINQDDSIELFLEPSVTTVAASEFFSEDFLDPTTRSVRTTVRVNDAETIVIGGLIDTNSGKSARKIPILGDLPFIGNAFKYDHSNGIDRELLIFMTPRIVESTASGSPLMPQSQNAGMSELLKESDMKRSLKEGEMKQSLKEGEMKRTLDMLGRPAKG